MIFWGGKKAVSRVGGKYSGRNFDEMVKNQRDTRFICRENVPEGGVCGSGKGIHHYPGRRLIKT